MKSFIGLFLLSTVLSCFLILGFFLSMEGNRGYVAANLVQAVEENRFARITPQEAKDLKQVLPGGRKSALDGLVIPDLPEVPIIAMIDNVGMARSGQAGLGQASIVFEAPVEAGITRFMAVFSSARIVDKIGPVRSARPYFVDWAAPFWGVFAHAGGSDEAFASIATSDTLLDLNENKTYYWRDSEHTRPHNLFTSTKNVLTFTDKQKWKHFLQHDVLPFYEEEPGFFSKLEEILDFQLHFSLLSYRVSYYYDPITKTYTRYQGQYEQKGVTPDNVVIMFSSYYVYDEEGRLHLKTQGEGEAWVFQRGKMRKGKWIKRGKTEKLRFVAETGEEIRFFPGQTWIELIDSADKVELSPT